MQTRGACHATESTRLRGVQALLYYVPTWIVSVFSNIVYDRGVSLHATLIQALSASDPHFNATWRANRTRHVFFLAGGM